MTTKILRERRCQTNLRVVQHCGVFCAGQTKFWQLFNTNKSGNVFRHSLGTYKIISGRAISALDAQRVYAQSFIASVPQNTELGQSELHGCAVLGFFFQKNLDQSK